MSFRFDVILTYGLQASYRPWDRNSNKSMSVLLHRRCDVEGNFQLASLHSILFGIYPGLSIQLSVAQLIISPLRLIDRTILDIWQIIYLFHNFQRYIEESIEQVFVSLDERERQREREEKSHISDSDFSFPTIH